MAAAGSLAGLLVLARHRGNETMEARLAGQFRVERRGEHISFANGYDPAIVQARQDVNVWSGSLDDRGADEHAVDRLVAEDGNGQVEDRLAETPTLDQLTHRRAFAARQDQAGDIVEIARQAHRNALHADHGE